MTRSRKVFLIGAAVFTAFMVFTVVDISRRTTFPGAKKTENEVKADTVKSDSSAKSATRPR